jgi:hypothetical protein
VFIWEFFVPPKQDPSDRWAVSQSLMHESIPGVTTPPPPGTPSGICPIDSSRGPGICLSYMCTGAGYWTIGGPQGFDKWLPRIPPTNFKAGFRQACGRADRILRHRGQGGVKFIVRISENYTLCHANLNTTILGLCFIIFHSSLIL